MVGGSLRKGVGVPTLDETMTLLLTLMYLHFFSNVSTVGFEQVNIGRRESDSNVLNN